VFYFFAQIAAKKFKLVHNFVGVLGATAPVPLIFFQNGALPSLKKRK
jgi:hypothetical protein